MPRHVIYAVDKLGLNIVTVSIVIQLEFNITELTGTVGKLFKQVYDIAEYMRIIRKRVIVFGICALPSQRNAVGVAAVPINKACVIIDSAGIAHAHGTVGVAAVKALVAVYLCAVVDLTEAVCRYLDRHLLSGRLLRIAYGKFAAVHVPSVYKLRAFLILVEIYNYIVTVICDTAR